MPAFPHKLRYIVGFELIPTNSKPAIYRNLYEHAGCEVDYSRSYCIIVVLIKVISTGDITMTITGDTGMGLH